MKVCSTCQRCYDDPVVSCAEAGHRVLSESRTGKCEMIAGLRAEYLLESGAKGEVYRARQIDSGASCLIRIIVADEQTSEGFLNDSRIATTLFDPNISDIYETGTLPGGEIYVVSEDANGQTLRDLLNNVGIPQLLTSVQIARQTAEALHALHQNGLLHRAIRPENIFLTTDSEHRLLIRLQNIDFGGVIEHSIVSNKFLLDSAIDSIRYFAPEQWSAEKNCAQTDVYSLGIVFYEMLAGEPPFDAPKAAELIEKHRHEPPPQIKINNFDLRMLLTHTLMESLQKQPGIRQSSANAFARQLRHIEQLATHSPTPPPAVAVSPSTPMISAAVAAVSLAKPARSMQSRAEAVPMQRATPSANGAAFVAVKVDDEPSKNIDVECDAAVDLPKIPEIIEPLPIPEILVTASVAPESHRSRLQVRKKRFHAKSFRETGASKAAITEPEQPELPLNVIRNVEPQKEETIAPAVLRQPTKINWEQPEDDIPSLDEVMDVRSVEGITDIGTIDAEPEKNVLVPAPAIPVKIEWSQPDDDIPTVEQVLEVISQEQLPVAHFEPEEITVVQVERKKITIDWEDPFEAEEFSSDPAINYFPTLLGNNESEKLASRDQSVSMFSAFTMGSVSRSSIRNRVLAIGGVIAAILAAFLFSDDIVRRIGNAGRAGDSVSAKTKPAPMTQPSVAQTNAIPPAEEPSLPNFEGPRSEGEIVGDRQLKPMRIGDKAPASEERSLSRPAKAGDQDRASRSVPDNKTVGKLEPLRSTLVISAADGKVSQKTEAANDRTDSGKGSIKNKGSGTTRPRIVQAPRK